MGPAGGPGSSHNILQADCCDHACSAPVAHQTWPDEQQSHMAEAASLIEQEEKGSHAVMHAAAACLNVGEGGCGMLVEGHHQIAKLVMGKCAVGIHPSCLQDLCVHLVQPTPQVPKQHLDGRDLQQHSLFQT